MKITLPTASRKIVKLLGLCTVWMLLFCPTAMSQVVQWSTYLNSNGEDYVIKVVKDSAGDIYVLGTTTGTDFPTTPGAFQTTLGAGSTNNITVSKISSATGSLIWSTYLGGSNDFISAPGIGWDAASNSVTVFGNSQSFNYPVVNGHNKIGGSVAAPIFSQLNAANGSLVYSTYLYNVEPYGGNGFPNTNRYLRKDGYCYFLSVDASLTKLLVARFDLQSHQFVYEKSIGGNNGLYGGNIYPTYGWDTEIENGEFYISGVTSQDDFPTSAGAFQTVYPRGEPAAYFLTKITPSGDIGFSTYAGSYSAYDPYGFDLAYTNLALGKNDLAFCAKFDSTLPVSPNGIPFNNVTFSNTGIMKIDRMTGALKHFTYIAPSNDYYPIHGMTRVNDELIVYGTTTSSYLPVTGNALQPRNTLINNTIDNKGDAFFLHIDSLDNIVYCSYLGGSGDDYFWTDGVSANKDNICFTGYTNSNNMTTTSNAIEPVSKNTASVALDIIVANYNRSTRTINYATYVGSNVQDYIRESDYSNNILTFNALCVQNANNIGFLSSDLPVTPDAFQKTMIGSGINNPVGAELRQYIGRINMETGKLVYGSYLGTSITSGGEQPNAIAVNGNDIFAVGLAFSNDYPTTAGAISNTYKNGADGYITKLSLCYSNIINDTVSPQIQQVCANSAVGKITGGIPQFGNTPVIMRNGVTQASQADQTNFTFQWEMSTDSITWTPIPEAIAKDYTPEPVATKTYFRRIASQPFCSNTHVSNVATIALNGFVPQKPDVGGDGQFFTCPGTNVTLGTPAISGTTYSWQPAADLSVNNAAQVVFNSTRKGAFTYILTATDANGCTANDTATIFNYGANAGPDKGLCLGKPALIGGAPISGLAGVTYNWSPAVGLSCTNCAQSLASGMGNNYVLTVTMPLQSGGTCTTKDTVQVYLAGSLPPDPAGPDYVLCATDSAVLGTYRVPGYQYFWSPGWNLSAITDTAQPVFNQFHDPLSPNYNPLHFILTATSNNGCTVTDTASIYLLNINLPTYYICRPASIGMRDYTRGEATYEWVDVTSGVETPVAPGELSSTNTAECTALLTPTVASLKTYRLKMTWRGKTCSKDINVNICGGGFICTARIKFKSVNNCPVATPTDSLTLMIDEPNPNMDYFWSPATGLNTTVGPVVKTGATSPITYTVLAVYRYDNSIFCMDTIKVNPPNAFAPVFKAPDALLCKDVTTNIGLPSVAGLDYSWISSASNGTVVSTVSDPLITATQSTYYYAKVTDMGTGCFTNDTVYVKVPVIPSNALVTKKSCSNGGFTIGAPAVPGFVYSWVPATGLSSSNIAQPRVVSNNASLNYIRLCTEPISGCSGYDTVAIQHIDTPTIVLQQPSAICQGAGNTVKIGNPRLDSVTYSWSPSTGLSNPNVAQPLASPGATTTYTLTANFPGGCAAAAVASVTVYVLPRPTVTASVVNSCNSSQLNATTNTVVPSYRWTPSNGLDSPNIKSPVATIAFPTTYTVVVTDTVTGCYDTASVVVSPSVSADAGANRTLCSGNTVQLGGGATIPGVSYTWTPNTGLASYNTAATRTLNTLPTGVYTYVLTASNGTCTNADTVKVTVNQTPQLTIDTAWVICKNARVQIGTTPQPGMLYVWSPATALSNAYSANPFASPLQTTAYALTATNLLNSCSAVANTVVTVNTTGAPVVSASSAGMCSGNTTALNANVTTPGSFSYEWTPDYRFVTSRFISSPVVSPDVTTTYQVRVTNNANGCGNTATTTVVVKDTCGLLPLLWLDFVARPDNKMVRLSWTVSMEQNNKMFVIERSTDGRLWTAIGSVQSQGNTHQQRTYESTDRQPAEGINYYRIRQVDFDGRWTYSAIRQVLMVNQQSGMVAYPNPTSGVVHYAIASFAPSAHYQLRITSVDGRTLISYAITNGQGLLSLSHLPSGVYVLNISNNKGMSENRKIVLQK